MNNLCQLIVRNLLFFAIFLISLFPNKLSAQLVTSGTTTNAFIRNQYIEAGFNHFGCYASTLNAPVGYIRGPNQGGVGPANGILGFVSCPSGNWSNHAGVYGDFILPGVIFEGFTVVLTPQGGNRTRYSNDRPGFDPPQIRPKDAAVPFTYNSAPGVYDDVTWRGGVSNVFDIDCRFQIVGPRIIHYTTITNVSSVALTNVYFSRALDADQEAGLDGAGMVETYNVVESQAKGVPGVPSWVAAYGCNTPAMITLFCMLPNSSVAVSGTGNSVGWRQLLNFPERGFDDIDYSTADPPLFKAVGEYSRILAKDASIEMAIFIGTIPVGGSVTVEHEIRLDQPPVVRFTNPLTLTRNEGESFTYNLTREHQLNETVTATVRLTNVSNAAAPDFVGVTALPHDFTVTFEPDSTAKTLTIEAANDCYDIDNKTFKLEIVAVTSSMGGLMSPPTSVTGIIKNVPSVLPMATITAFPTAICSGATSTLTAEVATSWVTPSMTYTWYNGATQMGTTTVSTNSISAAGSYAVRVFNSNGCTFTSNTVTVTASANPSVSLAASPSTICLGNSSTLTATVTSGTTTAMTYTWAIAGTSATTTSNTYVTTLTTTSTYSVSITNSDGCTSGFTAPQTITVIAEVTPTITISASDNNICAGTSVIYTSNISNGGSSPGYQWLINEVAPITGSTGSSYTYTPGNGDEITCVLTSSDPSACSGSVTSNKITMVIIPTVVPSLTIIAVPD
ncbi:MAG: hypothetical protein LBH91_06870 [Prevotellaceae bacterium]|jgi:hypothetical protein|nr:hypothetical protein [Prevotellaceae bacterium]